MNKNKKLETALIITGLFFLLWFLIFSSIYYSFADNVVLRSFLYVLTTVVSAVSYRIQRPWLDELTLVLDKENNICRLASGKSSGLSYSVSQKPLDQLYLAKLVERPVVKNVELAYGASRKRKMIERKIFLEFDDGEEIGWEYWNNNRPRFHLKQLVAKINRFIDNPNQNQLRLLFYDYRNVARLHIFICIVFPCLAVFHR